MNRLEVTLRGTYSRFVLKLRLAKKDHCSTPLIPALGKQRQVDLCEFKASLNYRVRPCFKFQAATKTKTSQYLSWDGFGVSTQGYTLMRREEPAWVGAQ